MNLLQEMSILAMRQFMGDRADSVLKFFGDRFNDHSQRIESALRTANERAWRSLEVALAGPSWWNACKTMLSPRDEKGLQQHIQSFLSALPATEVPGDADAFRKKALADLHSARRVGLVPGADLARQNLTDEIRTFARYNDPQQVIEIDRRSVANMAGMLRKEGYVDLAIYIDLRPGQGQPLLVQAVRYFFRREVETDERLSQGLTISRLDGLDQQLGAGLDGLHSALKEHGNRLEELLVNVAGVVTQTSKDVKATMEIASDTRDDVKQMREQLQEQSDQIRQLMQMLQQQLDQRAAPSAPRAAAPIPTVSTPTPAPVAEPARAVAAEWNQVRQLLARVQKLTPEEQQRRPDLARVAGRLSAVTQDYENTRRTIQNLQQGQSSGDPLPIYPPPGPILDALPADAPLPNTGKKLISKLFHQAPASQTPATETPAPVEEAAKEPAKPAPGKKRLLSPLFDPEQKK